MKWFNALSAFKQFAFVLIVIVLALGGALAWHQHAVAQLVARTTIATEIRISASAAGRLASYSATINTLRDSLQLQLSKTHTVFVETNAHVDTNAIADAAVTAALAAIKQEQREQPDVARLITTTTQLQASSEMLRRDFALVQVAYRADSVAWMQNLTIRDSAISALATKAAADSSIAARALDEANRHRLTLRKGAVVAGTGYGLVRALEWFVASRRH